MGYRTVFLYLPEKPSEGMILMALHLCYTRFKRFVPRKASPRAAQALGSSFTCTELRVLCAIPIAFSGVETSCNAFPRSVLDQITNSLALKFFANPRQPIMERDRGRGITPVVYGGAAHWSRQNIPPIEIETAADPR